MSGTNGYGAKDAGLRAQRLRGQIRWVSKIQGIQTTRGGPSGSFSADASNMLNTAFISDSAKECVLCETSNNVPLPNPPDNVGGRSGDGEITITWGSPRYLGRDVPPVTYRVTCPQLGFDQGGITVNTCTITGCTNGVTYTCYVYTVEQAESLPIAIQATPLVGGSRSLVFLDPANYTGGSVWPDTCGQGNSATLYNSPTWSSTNGGRFAFNGTNQYGQVPAGFADFADGITILSFVNFGSADTWERIIDFGNGDLSNNIILARNGTSSNLQFQVYQNTSLELSVSSTNAILNNNWGFFAARLDGASWKLWNKSSSNSAASTILPNNITRVLNYIGRSNWSDDEYFEGNMGVLAIYDSALTDQAVQDFFNSFKARYFTAPPPPTSVTAVSDNAQANVSFVPPVNDTGYPVTGYTVISSPGGITSSGSSSPITVTGLTNGTAYTFRVTATNEIGTSALSAASNSVTPATVPNAPTITSLTPGNGQVTVAFSAPSTGGSPITGYTVTSSPGSFTASGNSLSLTVTGLTNGTAYTFTVVAKNILGSSDPSNPSAPTIPATKPAAPTIGTATRGAAQASVAFTANSTGGSPITRYTVTAFTSGGASTGITATDSSSPIRIGGLTNGTPYKFKVTATNAFGTSDPSDFSNVVTPIGISAPDTPTNIVATRGNGQVTVSFDAPPDGGSAITDYTVTTYQDGTQVGLPVTQNSTSIPITGLTNGTAYTFTVYATNEIGNSDPSSPTSPVTPATVPDAPTSVSASASTSGDPGQVVVSFTPPASDGGADINDYTVTASPGGFTATGSASPITLTGLTLGTAYTFTVVGTNEVGSSTASTASSEVTPIAPPGAPTITTVTKGNSQVTVAFTEPAYTGGSTISGYTVTVKNGGTTVASEPGSTSPITVTGLTNGTTYTAVVTAANAAGTGSTSSPSSPFTPSTVPDAPTNVSASIVETAQGTATITFDAPPPDGGSEITGYTITSSPGNISRGLSVPLSLPYTFTGLSANTTYTFTVVATNANGNSTASAASNSVLTPTTPGAPTITSITPGDTTLTVNFTAGTTGNSTITSYQYSINSTSNYETAVDSDGNNILTSPIIITKQFNGNPLVNGTSYFIRIRAINLATFTGDATAGVSATPVGRPSAPTILSATPTLSVTPGQTSYSISFTAPSSTGGAFISNYEYSIDGGQNWTTRSPSSALSPISIPGLSSRTLYNFSIRAVNSAGAGDPSAVYQSPIAVLITTSPDTPNRLSTKISTARNTLGHTRALFYTTQALGTALSNYAASDLNKYDVVIWASYSNTTYSTEFGSNLNNYVAGGGHLIMTSYTWGYDPNIPVPQPDGFRYNDYSTFNWGGNATTLKSIYALQTLSGYSILNNLNGTPLPIPEPFTNFSSQNNFTSLAISQNGEASVVVIATYNGPSNPLLAIGNVSGGGNIVGFNVQFDFLTTNEPSEFLVILYLCNSIYWCMGII